MSLYVTFDETGKRLAVLRGCQTCDAKTNDFTIVSPVGTAHYAAETNERTLCGIDATRDGWWHRL